MQHAPRRTLRVTSPFMHGEDVRRLQTAINARRRARKLSTITVDGSYGPGTAAAYRDTGRVLGLAESTLKAGATRGAQTVIRAPKRRTPSQLVRARDRAKAAARQGEGPTAALKWATSKIGVKEHPPESNSGPEIRDWQKDVGMGAGPWCGAFAARSAKAGGVLVTDEARYVPSLRAHARNKTGGYEGWCSPADPLAKPGDHVCFDFDGGVEDHVGVLESVDLRARTVTTIDGNTGGAGQSQDNGGMVLRKTRSFDLVAGVARVRWAA